LLTTLAKLLGPGGARAIVADSLLMKQQLLIINRSRRRAPNLTPIDRMLLGFWSLFLNPLQYHLAPPKAALHSKLHLVVTFILGFLVTDVGPNHRLIQPHRRYKIPTGPEVLAGKIELPATNPPRHLYRTLALYITHYVRHRILRWNADTHVYMIRHQMTFDYPGLLLHCQLVKYFSQFPAQCPEYPLFSTLGDKYNVVLTIPCRVGKTLVVFHL
jgi:hypothetical protein